MAMLWKKLIKFSNQLEYTPVIKDQLKGWAANKKAFLDSQKLIEDQSHFMTLQNVLDKLVDF